MSVVELLWKEETGEFPCHFTAAFDLLDSGHNLFFAFPGFSAQIHRFGGKLPKHCFHSYLLTESHLWVNLNPPKSHYISSHPTLEGKKISKIYYLISDLVTFDLTNYFKRSDLTHIRICRNALV